MKTSCTFCGSHKHSLEYCPKTWNGQGNIAKRHCSYCGSDTHNADWCPKTWLGSTNLSTRPTEKPY